MKVCKATIEGIAPYSQSRPIQSIKQAGQDHEAFEEATWQERIHADEKGRVFMPPMAIKNALAELAKYMSESVPGKGKATYTKHFEAGILIVDPILLVDGNGKQIMKADVKGERLFLPSDGRRGGGKRVWKRYPFIPSPYTGDVTIHVLDPMLIDRTDKIKEYLGYAGEFTGVGRFRPRNNGFYGRFIVKSWSVGTTK